MKRYIFSEPFKGTFLNTITNGVVDYTGVLVEETYRDKNGFYCTRNTYQNGQTLKKYVEKKNLDRKTLKVVDEDTMHKRLLEYYDSLVTKWSEITEEKYWYYLEVLPPERWTKYTYGDVFFMSEALTGNIHGCVCQFKDKYYFCNQKININMKDLIATITNQLNT